MNKLNSRIDDLTSDLVVSRESVNKIKTNWTTTRIVKFHLDHIYINDPKKTNTPAPRTIDDIYFIVNSKNQGGYVVLYLKSGLPITRRRVTDILVKNLVNKAVDNMAADNKITNIKFENNSGVLLNTNYIMAGVDYEDKNANESEDINNIKQN